MTEVWVRRLVDGTKKWSELPVVRRSAVQEALGKMVADGILTAAEYKKITGKAYKA